MDGWLGDAIFFLWGHPLKIIRLDLIFNTCASTSSSHCFNVCENRHTYSYPFARTNISSIKNTCFAIWARVGVDTKFLNLSHHVLSMDGWPGDATFFLWGQPLKIIRMYSAKKKSSPLEFIFDTYP